jgi:hypothetical protein
VSASSPILAAAHRSARAGLRSGRCRAATHHGWAAARRGRGAPLLAIAIAHCDSEQTSKAFTETGHCFAIWAYEPS